MAQGAEDQIGGISEKGHAMTDTEKLALAVEALKKARYALVTCHNLRATDLTIETFEAHVGNAIPRDTLEWMTDNSPEIYSIDHVLDALSHLKEP